MREALARHGAPAAAVALAAATLGLALAAPETDMPDAVLVLVAAVAYACGAHASARAGAAAAGLLLAVLLATAGIPEDTWVPMVICVCGPWAAGRAVRSRRALVAALAERNRELADAEAAHAELAVRRERARIARELHDIVSHSLAVIAVQAGAGRMAAPEPEEGAAARFAAIRDAGRRTLVEMERLAAVLRDDGEPAGDDGDRFRRLLDAAAASGLEVRVRALIPETGLPPDLAEIAHRIVQEGVTNVLRHAPGAELHVTLRLRDGELLVELRDTGAGPAGTPAGAGAGLGLVGLHERVAEAGGRLEAGPATGGWRLRAQLPLRAAAPTPGG